MSNTLKIKCAGLIAPEQVEVNDIPYHKITTHGIFRPELEVAVVFAKLQDELTAVTKHRNKLATGIIDATNRLADYQKRNDQLQAEITAIREVQEEAEIFNGPGIAQHQREVDALKALIELYQLATGTGYLLVDVEVMKATIRNRLEESPSPALKLIGDFYQLITGCPPCAPSVMMDTIHCRYNEAVCARNKMQEALTQVTAQNKALQDGQDMLAERMTEMRTTYEERDVQLCQRIRELKQMSVS